VTDPVGTIKDSGEHEEAHERQGRSKEGRVAGFASFGVELGFSVPEISLFGR
jgi:hypothetical protein